MQKISIKSCLGCLAGFFAVSLLLVLAACTTREDTQRLERLLAEADSMNRHYVPFTTDSAMLQAVALADRHGTNTDRVRARYLLGCAYRDMGEAPQALDLFHQATDLADTTRADCDFLLLSKIHGQAGDLFLRQGLARNALKEYKTGERLAWLAKDTLTAILAYGQMSNCYFEIFDFDSTLIVSNSTRRLLLEHGDTMIANTFLAQSLSVLLSEGKYEEAAPLLRMYEFHSEVATKQGLYPQFSLLYYYKALYALGVKSQDSARYYINRLLESGSDLTYLNLAYSSLLDIYISANKIDSIKKYADLYTLITDSIARCREQNRLQEMQSLYNYQRHQELAEKRRQMILKRNLLILGLVLFTIFVCTLAYALFQRSRNRKNVIDQLAFQYESLKRNFIEIQRLKDINNVQLNDIIEDKQRAINELRLRLAATGKLRDLTEIETINRKIRTSEINRLLHIKLQQPGITITTSDHNDLIKLFEDLLPTFVPRLYELCGTIRREELDICLLERLGFTPKEMECLLGLKKTTLSSERARLAVKLFMEDTPSTKSFHSHIMNLL